MKNLVSSVTVAALLAVSGTVAGVAPAAAQEFELRIGPDGVRPIIREERRYYDDRRDDRRERRDSRGCSQREALSIARSEGLRRAEVVRSTPRSITVEGDTRRGPVVMRFANVRGCPEI